ncbi:adenylosuccinate lyase, partial [Escherichia coli]|nr:adenylosuccinate lyase [Escherichia coli]
MVERYSREIMAKKWDMQAKYDAWLKVELAAVKAWNKLGLINDTDCEKILKNAK